MANWPEEYVSLCLQRVNNKAFKNAIALAAQIQSTSHMIIVKNLTRELYFILESQLQSLSDVIGYYHDSDTKVIKITVHSNNFKPFGKSYNNLSVHGMTCWIQVTLESRDTLQ
jgi:hypothetical protein